jgi:diaminohydroxyphosphoribosylaminopyrimidine deaminase/5-amino-6-(5-phosphoribosylamino)uracil reductase
VSQVAVHKLRAQNDAILVGRHTALLDDPSLDIRHWAGRSPLRLVIDKNGSLPADLRIFNGTLPTVIYTACKKEIGVGKNVEQVVLDFNEPLIPQILKHLHSVKVNSLLVEGGAALHSSFIDADLWDEIRVECNENLVIGDGVKAPALPQKAVLTVASLFNNKIMHFVR